MALKTKLVEKNEPVGDPSGGVISNVDLAAQYADERELLHECIERVFSKGAFVGVSGVKDFETEIAGFCGVAHAVAVGSGTSALILSLAALNVGAADEVIVPPNSHFATAAAVVWAGAKPVFVDVGEDRNLNPGLIEKAITSNTKAIIPVHLGGRIADMDAINDLARRHGLFVIEDAAQAIGAAYRDRPAGSLGTVAAFSAHPLKILNAAGDAGFVTTDDAAIAERVSRLRNLGLRDRDNMAEWGEVARMDILQAEILRARLPKVPSIVERRRANAALYRSLLNTGHSELPEEQAHEYCAYHSYVIRVDRRDELQGYLLDHGVKALVHYPNPAHIQGPALEMGYAPGDFPVTEQQSRRILSLPVHQYLSDDDIAYVAARVNEFLENPSLAG